MDNKFLNTCKNGQKGVIQTFLTRGEVNVNKRNVASFTPLYFACQRGVRDIVSLLMENGTNAYAASNDSITQLQMCARSKNKDIIRMLVDADADVNVMDRDGRILLMWFTSEGKSDATQLILEMGADPTLKDNKSHSTMNIATSKGLKSLIAALARTDSAAMATNSMGKTLLHQVCWNGQGEAVRLLIENGADVNVLNDDSESTLFLAVHRNTLNIVEMLLKAGVQPDMSLTQAASPCI